MTGRLPSYEDYFTTGIGQRPMANANFAVGQFQPVSSGIETYRTGDGFNVGLGVRNQMIQHPNLGLGPTGRQYQDTEANSRPMARYQLDHSNVMQGDPDGPRGAHHDQHVSDERRPKPFESGHWGKAKKTGKIEDDSKQQNRDEEDEEDESDEDTSFCKLCKVHFDNNQQYYRHTRGLLHTQRQMAADASEKQESQNVMDDVQTMEHKPAVSGGSQQTSNLKPNQVDLQNSQTGGERGAEEEDEEEDDDDGTLYCKLCDAHFNCIQNYHRHTLGLLHAQRQMASAGDIVPDNPPAEEKSQASNAEPDGDYNVDQDEEEFFEDFYEEENMYTCELCDIKTTGAVTLKAHQNGRNHRLVEEAVSKGTIIPLRILSKMGPNAKVPANLKPAFNFDGVDVESSLDAVISTISEAVVGQQYVKGGQNGKMVVFYCSICECPCDTNSLQTHLIGAKHRMKYLKEHYPAVYELVRTHGGKKSQLNTFLEQACFDVERKEGRRIAAAGTSQSAEKKPDVTKKEPVKDMPTVQGKPPPKQEKKEKSSYSRWRQLPHEEIMARYRENRILPDLEIPGDDRRQDDEPGFGRPLEPHRDPPRWPEPDLPRRNYSPEPYRTGENLRHQRMLDYERHLFLYPEFGINPEEVRCRMFFEYERIGIPYEMACDRVLIQEARRVTLMDYMNDGMTLEEAQKKVTAVESRKKLIDDFVRQGIDPHEARSKAIVEEERNKLFEQYERQGITPLQARAKIMAGHDRMHLIREFERHGMHPEEARRRALDEETSLQWLEGSEKARTEKIHIPVRDDSREVLASKKLLEGFMDLGDTREQAENKVIAALRRQGVSTQEAIVRVQKIKVEVHEKPGYQLSSYSQDENVSSRSSGGPDQNRPGPSGSVVDYDKITPEEAKERLFLEYEKRGVPREQARIALIQELVRSGVPQEEAECRFSDCKRAESPRRRKEAGRSTKYTGYDHRRSDSSSSSSSSRSRSGRRSRSRRRSFRSSPEDRSRSGRRFRDRSSERWRESRSRRDDSSRLPRRSSSPRRRRSHQRSGEPKGRPTLTLGEELKERKRELVGRSGSNAVPFKQSRLSSDLTSTSASGPSSSGKSTVAGLLESLTDDLISGRNDSSTALRMSKALTSALLKYRIPDAKSSNKE